MLETFHKIDNMNDFVEKIKKDTIQTFLISYKDSKDFITKFNKDLLTSDDVEYEMKPFLIVKNNYYYIDNEQIETLIKNTYQQLVFKIMSKLVDAGVLELCWDSCIMNFVWRKKKYSRLNKVRSI
jgi:hypothetical protein